MDSFAVALSMVVLKCEANLIASALFRQQPLSQMAALSLLVAWRCILPNSACVLWILLKHASSQFKAVSA